MSHWNILLFCIFRMNCCGPGRCCWLFCRLDCRRRWNCCLIRLFIEWVRLVISIFVFFIGFHFVLVLLGFVNRRDLFLFFILMVFVMKRRCCLFGFFFWRMVVIFKDGRTLAHHFRWVLHCVKDLHCRNWDRSHEAISHQRLNPDRYCQNHCHLPKDYSQKGFSLYFPSLSFLLVFCFYFPFSLVQFFSKMREYCSIIHWRFLSCWIFFTFFLKSMPCDLLWS